MRARGVEGVTDMRNAVWIAGALLTAGLVVPATAQVAKAGGAKAGDVKAGDVKAGVDAWSRGDFPGAVAQWRGPAVAGDADAQFNLGQAYKLGRGVPADLAQAESWFRKAALQGHPEAEDNYGFALFQAGRKADAVPWLEKSVLRGEPRGQLVLGTMLFNGDGVPRDYPRAYALMTLASRAGLKAASETLVQMDQYVTPADRERGTALAQQYAAASRAAPAQGGRRGMMATDAAPAKADVMAAAKADRRDRPTPSPDRPVADRIAPHEPAPAQVRPSGAASRPPASPGKSAAAPTPAPAPAAGRWKIQLGAFTTQANARTQWSRVHGKLGNAQPIYAQAGEVIRLQASGFGSKAAAQAACNRSGVPCVVLAP